MSVSRRSSGGLEVEMEQAGGFFTLAEKVKVEPVYIVTVLGYFMSVLEKGLMPKVLAAIKFQIQI